MVTHEEASKITSRITMKYCSGFLLRKPVGRITNKKWKSLLNTNEDKMF